jgi:hypothetical protein
MSRTTEKFIRLAQQDNNQDGVFEDTRSSNQLLRELFEQFATEAREISKQNKDEKRDI